MQVRARNLTRGTGLNCFPGPLTATLTANEVIHAKESRPVAHEPRKPKFWTITTTEMTEEQAKSLADRISAEHPGVYADAVDPSAFFSLHLDRWTTELLRDALLALRARGGEPGGLLEDVSDWLDHQAEPYPAHFEDADRYQQVVD